MFRLIAKYQHLRAPRRAAAVLLALVLNVTLVPCAMAFEAAEDQHDCCPPEIRLDAMECCVIDDVTHDARGSRLWQDDDGSAKALLAPVFAEADLPAQIRGPESTGPPISPPRAVPVYKLNCVYLK